MVKFINWLKSFGVKMVVNILKSKVDVLAKKMADSVDIPFVSEANERKEAEKAINALISLIEELLEDDMGGKKVDASKAPNR